MSECCHRGRNEASNIEWDSGIDLRFAKHFYTDGSSMDGNVVVSERAGFSVPGLIHFPCFITSNIDFRIKIVHFVIHYEY